MWDKPVWEGVWLYLDSWDSVRLRTVSTHWNVPKKYGPHGELFCFLLKKEPMVLSELVEFGPCISAETVKACALIGLRTMAEENALRSNSDSSLDLGMAAQTALCAAEWAGSEDASSLEYYEHNVGNLAIEVVGQNWSSEVISLFLEDWEVGRVALSCHLSMEPVMPRDEGCVWGELGIAGSDSFS